MTVLSQTETRSILKKCSPTNFLQIYRLYMTMRMKNNMPCFFTVGAPHYGYAKIPSVRGL